jgi:hypothetical protein
MSIHVQGLRGVALDQHNKSRLVVRPSTAVFQSAVLAAQHLGRPYGQRCMCQPHLYDKGTALWRSDISLTSDSPRSAAANARRRGDQHVTRASPPSSAARCVRKAASSLTLPLSTPPPPVSAKLAVNQGLSVLVLSAWTASTTPTSPTMASSTSQLPVLNDLKSVPAFVVPFHSMSGDDHEARPAAADSSLGPTVFPPVTAVARSPVAVRPSLMPRERHHIPTKSILTDVGTYNRY